MSKTRRSTEFKNQSRVIDMEEARAQRQAKRAAQNSKRRSSEKPQEKETRGKRAIRRKRNRTRLMWALFVLIIIGLLILASINVITLLNEKHQVEEQHEALLQEKEQLEEQLNEAGDPNAVEDEARAELKLVRPGEVLYMFSEEVINAAEQKE